MAGTDPFAAALAARRAQSPADPFGAALAARRAGQALNRTVGKDITRGHDNPFTAFANFAEIPQRAGLALIEGKDVGHAIADPSTREDLMQPVYNATGVSALEAPGAILDASQNDLPRKLGRGLTHFVADAASDPVSWLPVGKVAELAGKAIPGVAKGAAAIGKWYEDSPLGHLLNPEDTIKDYAPHERAAIEAALNVPLQKTRQTLDQKSKVIAQYADDIQNGNIPPAVKALFIPAKPKVMASGATVRPNPAFLPTGRFNMRPQEVEEALAKNHADATREAFKRNLINAGFDLKGADKDLAKFGLSKSDDGNVLAKWAQLSTHLGNQMFLANPVPHVGNLSDLSYQEYGIMRTLAGLGDALRVASGKVTPELQQRIDELSRTGAHAQYGRVFSGHGLTAPLGSRALGKAANTVVVPFQKASNALQDKILNPVETGLRASALRAENARGVFGEEAARNINRTFGSAPSNRLTQGAEAMGAAFPKFHAQTAVGQGLRTLATNPGRVTNVNKANLDFNEQVNPSGPQYRQSIPGLSTARAITDAPHYFQSLSGPIGELASNFSSLTELQKGKVSEALSQLLHKYIPLDQVVETLYELSTATRGKEGETGVQDLAPSLIGGYYHKREDDRR